MGFATALKMGEDHHVVIADVKKEALDEAIEKLRAKSISCSATVCDITNRLSVDELFKSAAEHGPVKSVIHTAGVSPHMGNAEMILKINATGTINVVHSFLKIADEGMVCVNVASMAGYLFPNLLIPTRAYKKVFKSPSASVKGMLSRTKWMPRKSRPGVAYSFSKNFVQWYSKKMACTIGTNGARILSVSPGSFDTAMGRLEEKDGAGQMITFGALKRFGRPEEVAELLAFCASEKASYITGIDIPIDGGVTACITPKDLRSAMK